MPAWQDIGDLAHDPRRGRRPAHRGPVQPDRLQGVSRQGPVHAGDEHAPPRALPPARGIRGADAARARMHDPAWKERYRRRAGVEGTLSQGVRAFGMRRSRYLGLAKTGLQQVCTAAAINVSRVVHWLNGQPRAKTRLTRFAALAAAA